MTTVEREAQAPKNEEGLVGREYYPDDQAFFRGQLPTKERRFEALREALLLDYCYNTARAYAADLDDIYDWCQDHELDILVVTEPELDGYFANMLEMGYSKNTIRRRRTSLRGFGQTVASRAGSAPPALLDQ